MKPLRFAFIALTLLTTGALAQDVARHELDSWLEQDVTIDPPAAGTVIEAHQVEMLRPWIPPGLIDEFRFPEMRVEIQATQDYPGHHTYVAATERFSGQARIGSDGRLENYVAGQPFSDQQIVTADTKTAGYMVAWNQIHRWQYSGYKVADLTMTYVGSTPGQAPADSEHGLLGGGDVTRRLSQAYHRVYLSKLAWLSEQNYRMDLAANETVFFKDFIEFLAPFDVKGTKFVVERYLDPHADDQVNIYSPTERRVRRFSAKERADRFMGSEGTLDDFEGFSGRVLDYVWTYLGKGALLYVADSKHAVARGFGPYSRLPMDQWQVRDCHVVEVISTWDKHPYGSRILFIDTQTYGVALSMVFDHDAQLWKLFQTVFRGPAPQDGSNAPIETSVPGWRGEFIIDRKTNKATIVQALSETVHPTMNAAQIRRIFNVSNLTSGR